MSRDDVAGRQALRRMQEQYEYWPTVPHRGLTVNGRPAMTQIDPDEVGSFVLVLVRDPLCAYEDDPAQQVAQKLDGARKIGDSGMFSTWSGSYDGAAITVVSGGSGSAEAELALYDFMEFTQATTFMRVGGSAGIADQVKAGDIVISTGVVREEAMTQAYIDRAFPAVSHYEVVMALAEAAEQRDARYHLGVTLSVDSDFVGVGRPGVGGYLQPRNIEMLGTYSRAGVLNNDRESAAIVTLSALFGFRGGSVCSISDNVLTGSRFEAGAGHVAAIDIALDACAVLDRMDKAKAAAGKANWLPSLSIKSK